jgi:hypothetical protein
MTNHISSGGKRKKGKRRWRQIMSPSATRVATKEREWSDAPNDIAEGGF